MTDIKCPKCGAPTKKTYPVVDGHKIELDVFTCGPSCPRRKAERGAVKTLREYT